MSARCVRACWSKAASCSRSKAMVAPSGSCSSSRLLSRAPETTPSYSRWSDANRRSVSARSSASRLPASGCGIARSSRARRVVHAGFGVGVWYDELTLEAVRVTEENAQDRPEVGHEVVGRAALHQPAPSFFECLERSGLDGEVVDAATTEHRCLSLCLGVALDLEDVELRTWADPDDRHARPALIPQFGAVARHLSLENLAVERVQPIAVLGQCRDMVEPAQQHVLTLIPFLRIHPPIHRYVSAHVPRSRVRDSDVGLP